MTFRIRKAVFPVGGLGPRFLPATKALPKEMLPVVDKPLIHYAVEEARAAGIEEFIFVTGKGKSAIEDLQAWLPAPGKVAYTRQQEPLGLGHAVWCARHLVGDEPFAVLLADDLILSAKPCLKQMVEAYRDVGGNMVAALTVADEAVSRYGMLKVDGQDGPLVRAAGVVEKPPRGEAPSNLAVIGRYILVPQVFEFLDRQERGAGGEIQLTDAIAWLADKVPLHGWRFEGQRFDCGVKAEFLQANIAFALAREDMRDELLAYLRTLPDA